MESDKVFDKMYRKNREARQAEKDYAMKMIERINRGKLDTERGIDRRTDEDRRRIDYWMKVYMYGE